MKRNFIALLLALSMMMTLAACGGKKEEAAASSTPAASSTVENPDASVEEPDASIEEPAASEEAPADPGSSGPSEPVTEEKPAETKPADKTESNTAAQAPAQSTTVEAKPQEKPAGSAPESGAASVDLNAFYVSLTETYGENFPANMNLCEMVEVLDSFYPGLSAVESKQMLVYQPMMGAVVCEIALVEVANAADVETVKAICQARIDAQVDGGAWYPESIEGWKLNSRVVAKGNHVMMIAYDQCDAVVDAFNALF